MRALTRHAVHVRGLQKVGTIRMKAHEVVAMIVTQHEHHVARSICGVGLPNEQAEALKDND